MSTTRCRHGNVVENTKGDAPICWECVAEDKPKYAAEQIDRLSEALKNVLWMAEKWAEGGGRLDPAHESIADARAALNGNDR